MNVLATNAPVNSTHDVPVASKRELAKAKTRKAILKSALRLYSIEGSCGMSMNKIAKGAGIAQPSFYNHFASLEVLEHELSAQLKDNYLSPIRMAWVTMLEDYTSLDKAQFYQRCQQCLGMIFDAAFVNIYLFQRLIEDRVRAEPTRLDLSLKGLSDSTESSDGLGHLINEIQEEWTQIFIEGLLSAECNFEHSQINLSVDIATAQVHELILGCHQQRYSRAQAIAVLSKNFDTLFESFWYKTMTSQPVTN